MSWLIDKPNIVYLVFGIAALGFVTAWWLNKRVKFLAYAAVALLPIGIVWLLTQVIHTDRKDIQQTVQTMADAVVRGDQMTLFSHTARDFRYKQLDRDQLAATLKGIAARHKITEVNIWEFDCDDVSRDKGIAKAHFKATVFDKDGLLAVVYCLATFVREDDQWKLRDIEFRNATRPDEPMPGAP